MPNHIQTLLVIEGPDADIEAFITRCILDIPLKEGEPVGKRFSLDSIIPMPKVILDTIRPMWKGENPENLPLDYGGDAIVEWRAECVMSHSFMHHPHRGYTWLPNGVRTYGELKAWIDEKYPGADFWAKRMLKAAAEAGHTSWYDWSVANWGTKWDAYSYKPLKREPGRLEFTFQTAQATPKPVLQKASELFPTLTFLVESIDEGGGEFEGHYKAGVGEVVSTDDDDARYERVYGHPRPVYDDEDEDEEVDDEA